MSVGDCHSFHLADFSCKTTLFTPQIEGVSHRQPPRETQKKQIGNGLNRSTDKIAKKVHNCNYSRRLLKGHLQKFRVGVASGVVLVACPFLIGKTSKYVTPTLFTIITLQVNKHRSNQGSDISPGAGRCIQEDNSVLLCRQQGK